MTRFQVITVEGFRIDTVERGRTAGNARPGMSATVYDSVYDRDIATYRTEDFVGPWPLEKRAAKVLWLAEAHAERLNREHGEVAA